MNIHILHKYSCKNKSRDRSFFHYGREQRNIWRVRPSTSQKISWHSDKRKCMSFFSHPEWKYSDEGVSQASLTLTAFSQALGWGPRWGNPLSDRERRKRKGKQGLKGRLERRKADDISNLYPLQYQPNYKVLIAQVAEERSCKIPHMMSVLVVFMTIVAWQPPTCLRDTYMRLTVTKQQPHPSTGRKERRRKKKE